MILLTYQFMQPIKAGFESSGFKPEILPLKDFEDDYGMKTGNDEDEESEEEEEEEEEETGSEESGEEE